jgi:large conductance mechanosensitive channel
VEPTFETVVNAEGAEVVQEVHNYLTYGNFISAVINFLILAAVVFFIVKFMNQLSEAATRKEREEAEAAAAAAAAAAAEEAAKNPPAPPAPTAEELLAEIRDLLKNK